MRTLPKNRLIVLTLTVLLSLGAGLLVFWPTFAAQLLSRQLEVSNSNPGATSNYNLSFNVVSSGTLGSISVQFCSNSPIIGDSCTVPSGFDISKAVLISQSGATGFTISPLSTANVLVLSRPPANQPPVPVNYVLSGVVNPSSSGSYYARVLTYSSIDASGIYTNYGGIAYAINNILQLTTVVPPYLTFCGGLQINNFNCTTASGNYIDFGAFASTRVSSGQSQLLAATNAANGYSINYTGTTLTSGNNIILALSKADVSRPGTSQFGLNLAANISPSVGLNVYGPGDAQPQSNYDTPNFYLFNSGDEIASSLKPNDYRDYTISYIANVPRDQAPGIYTSTITYICLPNF